MCFLNPKGHFEAVRELIGLFTRHSELTWEMTKREINDRYAGQVFGTLWALGHPLILMGIYLFVFGFVFKAKVGGTIDMPLDYTTYMLAGIIPWMAVQESMSKGSTVIVSNASLVKQVVFPIEILPVKGVIVSLITQAFSTVVLIGYVLLKHHMLPWTYLLLPVLVILQAAGMIGISYILSAIGVFFRDIKELVAVFCTAGIYLMPIFYLPDWIPWALKPLLFLNPLSHLVWCFQDACYFGRFEHPWSWLLFSGLSLFTFYAGYRIFRKLKILFGNAL